MHESWTNSQSTTKHQPWMDRGDQSILNTSICTCWSCAAWLQELVRSSSAGFAKAGSSDSKRSWSRQVIFIKKDQFILKAVKENDQWSEWRLSSLDWLTERCFSTETLWHTAQTVTVLCFNLEWNSLSMWRKVRKYRKTVLLKFSGDNHYLAQAT